MPHAYLSKTSLKQVKQDGIVERDFKFYSNLHWNPNFTSLAEWAFTRYSAYLKFTDFICKIL